MYTLRIVLAVLCGIMSFIAATIYGYGYFKTKKKLEGRSLFVRTLLTGAGISVVVVLAICLGM